MQTGTLIEMGFRTLTQQVKPVLQGASSPEDNSDFCGHTLYIFVL